MSFESLNAAGKGFSYLALVTRHFDRRGGTGSRRSSLRRRMTTQAIADRFVSLCRQGQFETAQRELFSPEVVSTEPYGTPTFPQETVGLPAVLEKAKTFTALIAEV